MYITVRVRQKKVGHYLVDSQNVVGTYPLAPVPPLLELPLPKFSAISSVCPYLFCQTWSLQSISDFKQEKVGIGFSFYILLTLK